MLTHALHYAHLGYAVFPCCVQGKTPACSRGVLAATRDENKIRSWWTHNPKYNIGLAADGLVVLDVDAQDHSWLTPDRLDDLQKTATTRTPRGGMHFFFSAPSPARWKNTVGKIAPRIDTRCSGGYVLVPPSFVSAPYVAVRELPRLTELGGPPQWLCEILDQHASASQPAADMSTRQITTPINDQVVARAIAYLAAMPPAVSGQGGHNATYAAATALVHGFGLSPDRALELLLAHYNPRCQPPWTEKELRHKVQDAATKPHNRPFGYLLDVENLKEGEPVDISQLLQKNTQIATKITKAVDPGPIPDHLLHVPGFVDKLMTFCLRTAPYPNKVLAFCGALAMQGFLAGRKICDPGDNRTNLYILGLAHSASGKDWPRKINVRIMHELGICNQLGERFASGEGIQDALFLTPNMLFQTDEIDGLLQQINTSIDARYENILSTLLTVYSTSNSIYPMRRKAGTEVPAGVIDQPCLTIFGTAIPNHYYSAMSERMLTNGFFARMLVLEAGSRGEGQDPVVAPIPEDVLQVARWWCDFKPTGGNLHGTHPRPLVVQYDAGAIDLIHDLRKRVDSEYMRAERDDDAVGTTIWGRAGEHVRKLALIYAASKNNEDLKITCDAVTWASECVIHLIRQMLFRAQTSVADSASHRDCMRALGILRAAPDGFVTHSALLRKLKCNSKTLKELVSTLEERGDIVRSYVTTDGRPVTGYKLACE